MKKQSLDFARLEALKLIEPSWMSVMTSLERLFPEATVTGRLRPDVYHDNDGVLTRDSAGTRVIFDDAQHLDEALKVIQEEWPGSETRDYRKGHPRSIYYRAVHFFVRDRGSEVEIQLRTRRQHLIAEWAHDKLIVPSTQVVYEKFTSDEILSFLNSLSCYYDGLDRNKCLDQPPVPSILKEYSSVLGLG